MTPPKAPASLGAKARRLWRDTVAVYELRPDELRVLEDACREVDVVERLEVATAGGPLTVAGSTGQDVAHPLLQELRHHRGVLMRLLGSLRLGDAEDSGSRSAAGRALVSARWKRGA